MHPFESVKIPKDLTLCHGRVIHFERLFPPQKVYQQCTYGMTKRIKLQQTNWNVLCDYKVVLA